MNCTRRRATGALLGLSATAAFAPAGLRANEPRTYRFSPVNQYGIELTARYWNPIIDHVSARSGVKLELKIGRTSADTTAYVLANEVEFVFSNHLFSPEREGLGWRVIARRQTAPLHSQIVVLAESPAQKLEDLQGLVVAFPGPEATVAYKFAYAQLLKRNVNVQVVFGGNMDGAFAQLASGKAAAAGTHTQLAEGWSRREGRKLRALWSSEPLHDLPLMVSRKVPQADVDAVARAFTGMLSDPAGQRVLSTVGELVKLPPSAGFVASNGSEYGAYRNFFATAPAQLR